MPIESSSKFDYANRFAEYKYYWFISNFDNHGITSTENYLERIKTIVRTNAKVKEECPQEVIFGENLESRLPEAGNIVVLFYCQSELKLSKVEAFNS